MDLGILEEQMGRTGNRKSAVGGQLRGQAVLILKAVEMVASCSHLMQHQVRSLQGDMKEGGAVIDMRKDRVQQMHFIFTGKGSACFGNAKAVDVPTVRVT